jgi:serine/threonine protein phosphatase 1
MPRVFVLGDIHGHPDNLKRVLAKSKFDSPNDRLIVLGDIGDRGPDMKGAVEELLKVKNITLVLGNHDLWFIDWLEGGKDPNWDLNGGSETRKSYGDDRKKVPASHKQFFKKGKPYHEETIAIDGKRQTCLFVHGGFDPERPIAIQNIKDLTWDRKLFRIAMNKKIPGYDRIFIGHNRTVHLDEPEQMPVTFNNVTMMDTGVDAGGKLSLLELTKMKIFRD